MASFNLNVDARVMLTKAGSDHLNRRWIGREPVEPGHVITCEFWRLMADFGQSIGMGLPTPFEGNVVELEPFTETRVDPQCDREE